ncbi:MAG: ABC transporter substrate-binding protein [Lentisphaeria bacterium]
MNKTISPLFIATGMAVTALFVIGSGCGKSVEDQATSGKPQLSYAMSGLYKPFNYKQGGKLVGFDVDIGKELCKRLDYEPHPVTTPWQTIIQGLKAKKYDAILGSMAITEERREQVAFSTPYYHSGAQLFVQKSNTAVTDKKDLRGKRIGVVKASTFKDVAEKLTAPDNVIGYDSDVIALQDLTTGRIDAVLTDRLVGLSAINNNDLPIKEVAAPLYIDAMGIAVRKSESEQQLLAEINQALAEIIADGTYAEISRKWFGRNILKNSPDE